MTSCLVGLAILSLVLALVLGGVAKKSSRYEERRTYAGWAIACMVTFFVLFLLADLGTGPIEAHQQALQCVASNLKVSVDEVSLGEDVCISSNRGSCRTWKARFQVGETTGTVEYDLDSCVITVDKFP
ncbi:hypothetical protein A3H19_00455 [Candidatus Woesebacteria bacterium RIFCSPLOWO2_12_FULL_39_9]|nr:MAG: hypothetical protein A3H19_00455 [Candidatus Woesebacteria bacterium RIFCSPLOWO2_12_FULL_39_9]